VSRAGFSLVEVLIAVLIVFVLAAQGVHHYSLATEDARVDTACATLRSIWVAERLYRMEHTSFDTDLADLAVLGLVEKSLADEDQPFVYSIVSADADAFVARAQRHGSISWVGAITIDATGALAGSIESSEGEHVSPPVP
jgi:prepilin-type N-terminal cleavage/methylation domain-containing protein